MRDMTQAFRDACLATDRKPTKTVKLRKRKLDFGTTYNTVLTDKGDDIGDITGEAVAGDSAQHDDGRVCRVSNWSAAALEEKTYFSAAHPTGDLGSFGATFTSSLDWDMADYARPGVSGGSQWSCFYFDDDNETIKRRTSADGISWNAASTVWTISGWAGVALAPISSTEVWACYLSGVKMMVRRFVEDSGWSGDTAYCLSMNDDFTWSDAQWFDVAIHPTDADRRVIIYSHAPHYAAVRIWEGSVYGELWPLLPSDQEYVYQRTRVSGLTKIGSYLWAVCKIGLESTSGAVYSPYFMLLRSSDGIAWAPMASTGQHECRGKVFAECNKVVVVSPATVMLSDASGMLGDPDETDISDEVAGWDYRFGEDIVGETVTNLLDPTDTTLFLSGTEIQHYFGVVGQTDNLLTTQILDMPQRQLSDTTDAYSLLSRGPLALLDNAPVADNVYQGGFAQFRTFETPALVYMEGSWDVYHVTNQRNQQRVIGTHDDDGADVFSIAIDTNGIGDNFTARCHFWCVGSASPVYLAFWAEDAENHWRFGHNGAQFVLQKVVDGTAATKASGAGTLSAGTTYHYSVVVRGDVIYGYIYTGGTWTLKCTYTYVETAAPPRGMIGLAAQPDEDAEVLFGWLYYREAKADWNHGRIAKGIAASVGLDLTVNALFTGTTPAGGDFTNAGSGYYMTEIKQVEVDVDTIVKVGGGTYGIVIGASSYDDYTKISGWAVTLQNTSIKLQHISEGVLDPRQEVLYTMPITARVRIGVSRGLVEGSFFNVWVNEQFAAGFVVGTAQDDYAGNEPERGYVGTYVTGGADSSAFVINPFSYYTESYTHTRGATAGSAIKRLLHGSLLRMVEQADDTAVLQQTGDALGTYQHVLVSYSGEESNREWASVIRINGYDMYVEYVHGPLLRRGTRVFDIDLHYLYLEIECLQHARRMGEYFESLVNGRSISGHLDPAVLPGDTFLVHADIESFSGIVRNGSFRVKDNLAEMSLRARENVAARDIMRYGTDNWDERVWG